MSARTEDASAGLLRLLVAEHSALARLARSLGNQLSDDTEDARIRHMGDQLGIHESAEELGLHILLGDLSGGSEIVGRAIDQEAELAELVAQLEVTAGAPGFQPVAERFVDALDDHFAFEEAVLFPFAAARLRASDHRSLLGRREEFQLVDSRHGQAAVEPAGPEHLGIGWERDERQVIGESARRHPSETWNL
jgi:hypothetical protein